MGPVLYSRQAVLTGTLILALSFTAFAQILSSPDTSGFPLGRRAPAPPIMTPPYVPISHPPFEFRGIRIGDEMKGAERKFLALNAPSLSSMPGLCGSDGMGRIETCTDVLDTGST